MPPGVAKVVLVDEGLSGLARDATQTRAALVADPGLPLRRGIAVHDASGGVPLSDRVASTSGAASAGVTQDAWSTIHGGLFLPETIQKHGQRRIDNQGRANLRKALPPRDEQVAESNDVPGRHQQDRE